MTGLLHGNLRERSAAAHREVEAHPLLRDLLQPTLTRAHYVTVLSAFLGWYATLEAWLRPAADALSARWTPCAWRYRPRVPALERDLAQLCDRTDVLAAPPLACASGASALIGVLYVVEGSSLGGRVIAGRVRASLGPSVPVGHFLAPGSASWPAFLDMIGTHGSRLDAGRAVSADCMTFEHLRQHLDACRQGVLHA